MKKMIWIMAVILPVLVQGQIIECKQANEFEVVQVYDGIVATFSRGDKNELCEGTDTKLDDLQITIENNVLRIRKIPGKNYVKQPRIRIVYNNVDRIEGYANADLNTENLILNDSLTIVLKTGSRFYADCDVKYLSVDISEGSLLKIDGYAVHQNILVSGKATFSGFELEGTSAEVKAVRGGTAKMFITDKISGSATTSGHIGYKESPVIDVKTSLGGKVVAN